MRTIHKGGYKKIYPEKFAEVREQIQEDLITYFDNNVAIDLVGTINMDEVCQIVVDNFKKLEDK